jgi:putative Ca2+/H+ antiporter (TMEM165/GDT1 family)
MVDLEMTTTNEVTLRVVNATGQTVINQYLGAIQSDRIEVRTADLTTGVYFMHFTIGNEHISRKLIVSKR